MKDKYYGHLNQTAPTDEVGRYVEEVERRGFTVIPDCWSPDELHDWRQRLDAIYVQQERTFGRESLAAIQELDVCRAPLLYDRACLQLAMQSVVLAVVERFLGPWFILNLQNATLLRPGVDHHQRSWHRDMPYQHRIASGPLAINALVAIDEFSDETGGTELVPYTHKHEVLPSDDYIERHRVGVCAPAGAVIVFDTHLLHRAGFNRGQTVRRAVNHLYTIPIFKQQYDFPRALGEAPTDPRASQLLGFSAQVPVDDQAWRRARMARLEKRPVP